MTEIHDGLDIVAFDDAIELRRWLATRAPDDPGVWVRLRRAGSVVPSVTFHEVLEEGLAFGWSESTRHRGDHDSYLQRFAPRRSRGTVSERNRRIAERLDAEGRLTEQGRRALAW